MLDRLFGHAVNVPAFTHWITWNLLLAVIPVVLGYCFLAVVRSTSVPQDRAPRIVLAVLLFLAWLAFVPNTCYLLTEWRHFLDSLTGPVVDHPRLRLSAEGLFYFIYSGLGVLCFTLALRPMERALRLWGVPFPLLAFPLFFLISLGVYLGLVLRLNSWDILSRPGYVFAAAIHTFNDHPLAAAILVFGLLLWGLYEGLDIWVDGIADRWSRRNQVFARRGTSTTGR